MNKIANQTYIVTGASRGLGLEAVRSLADNPSAVIIMAGHNQISLNYAMKSLKKQAQAQLITSYVNLADLNSVRMFVNSIVNSNFPPLSCVICNAGIIQEDNTEKSVDGYELTFAVNYLSHFLLTLLLLNYLISPARIIIVGSRLHYGKRKLFRKYWNSRYTKAEWFAYPELNPRPDDIEEGTGIEAYADSMLCNTLFTYELSRRLRVLANNNDFNKKVSANIFDPGLMSIPLQESTNDSDLKLQKKLFRSFNFESSISTVEESGKNLAWLASSPEVAGVSNSYFVGRRICPSSIESRNIGKASDLWDTSIKMASSNESEFEWIRNCKSAYA